MQIGDGDAKTKVNNNTSAVLGETIYRAGQLI
jgi:hypothetical protein